jgi:hypothetical protein
MNVRGLLPSLGAGGSLIAAALCALVVFGGVLAFRGEAPGTADASSGDLKVPAGAVRARTASRTPLADVIALARAAVAAPRLAPTTPQRPRSRGRSRTRIAVPRPTASPPRTTTPVSTTPAPTGGTRTPTPTTPPATPPTPSPPPVITGSGTVQNVVTQTRAAAKPVLDAVPAPVQGPVNAVGDTVEQVAGTVDQTVDGLTGALLP